MPIGLRIRGLFEDLPRRAVAHAYDVQATVSSVAPLSFEVIDGVYASFTVGSYLPYACSRYWQDFSETVPGICSFVRIQRSLRNIESGVVDRSFAKEITFYGSWYFAYHCL